MDGEPDIGTKGTHIIQARGWVDDSLGKGSFDRLSRDAGVGSELTNPVAMRWYSVPALVKTLQLVAPLLNLSVEGAAGQIAVRNAKHDLKTIYRVFMTVVGPVNVLKRSEQMYRTYQNFGAAKTTRNEPGNYECVVQGIPTEVLAWSRSVGPAFLSAAVAAAGGESPVAESADSTVGPDGRHSWTLRLRYR